MKVSIGAPGQGCWYSVVTHKAFHVTSGLKWTLDLLFSRRFQISLPKCQNSQFSNLSMVASTFLFDAYIGTHHWVGWMWESPSPRTMSPQQPHSHFRSLASCWSTRGSGPHEWAGDKAGLACSPLSKSFLKCCQDGAIKGEAPWLLPLFF